MDKEIILNKTFTNIQKLSATKVKDVNDFAEFLLSKSDDQIIVQGIQKIASSSKSLDFLNQEPDLYSVNDLKVEYK